MIRSTLTTSLYLFLVSLLGAQSEQFLQANSAYNQAEYETSIKLYEEILTQGSESSDLYLNLGNSYLQSNKLGKAILSFEKGLKLDNRHTSLKQNLKYAKKQIEIPITPIPEFFLSRYWNNTVNALSSNGWAVLQILFLLGMVVSIGFWLIRKSIQTKKRAFYIALVCCILFLLSLTAGLNKNTQMKSPMHAIVMHENAKLLGGASDQSELLLDLSAGIKVKLLDQIDQFYKVELIDKEVGWIAINAVEAI